MKWILIIFLALPFARSSAQNLGKQSEWSKSVAAQIPLKSGSPYYDTTVSLGNDATKDKLLESAKYYFHNLFGSDLVKSAGKYAMVGCANYVINLGNTDDEESRFKITYLMTITTKDGEYNICMHDFSFEHVGSELDFSKKLHAAKDNNELARRLLTIFHHKNLDELNKACAAMPQGKKDMRTVGR